MPLRIQVFFFTFLAQSAIGDAAIIQFSPFSDLGGPNNIVWVESDFRIEGNHFGLHESTDLTSLFGGIWPTNGTDFLRFLNGANASITTSSGLPFNAVSVDLAEYSQVFEFPAEISFVGIRADGTRVETTFTTDGIITGADGVPDFQTFEFPQEFVSLRELSIPDGTFGMDNLALNVIPEPSSLALILATVPLLSVRRSRRLRSARRN